MTKQEYIRILMLLSQLEGYLLGKTGEHIPEPMSEDIAEICRLLAYKIKEDSDDDRNS